MSDYYKKYLKYKQKYINAKNMKGGVKLEVGKIYINPGGIILGKYIREQRASWGSHVSSGRSASYDFEFYPEYSGNIENLIEIQESAHEYINAKKNNELINKPEIELGIQYNNDVLNKKNNFILSEIIGKNVTISLVKTSPDGLNEVTGIVTDYTTNNNYLSELYINNKAYYIFSVSRTGGHGDRTYLNSITFNS